MWYGSTKTLLESVVRWLQADRPQDDAERQAQTELVQACLGRDGGDVRTHGEHVEGIDLTIPFTIRLRIS